MGTRRNPILPPADNLNSQSSGETKHEAWLDYLPPPRQKAKRKRQWEANHRTTLYRGVPSDLRDAVRDIAVALEVTVDDVARAFLEYSLQCIRTGTLILDPRPSSRPKAPRMTLFPFHGAGWAVNGWPPVPVAPIAKKRQSSKEVKKWQAVVSYRLPPELHQQIKNIAEDYLPIGEVAAVMLQHALQAYQSGILILKPQVKQSSILGWSSEFSK
mgnify:CR=1 FL=1